MLVVINGVLSVSNNLAVVPTESYKDKIIAEEIVNALERNVNVPADNIEVTVENGSVTLEGNVTNHLIIPTYENFNQTTNSLHSSSQTFTENPSPGTLENLKSAWEQSIKSWKRAEIYNFGPVENLVLVTAIDRWPTSERGIEQAIDEFDGSSDYLVRIGSNRKGVPAIEYLFFMMRSR